ncbi:MAG: hypothetical protein E5V92_04170 [Mesorhizobium sp.]|nr:MAG: hypothetical protein EOS61_10100 [Mesorhizobium sp.]TJW89043.1 MAG: hypothetical protein E5V92_04170 [Mesorhizobium sp.]
MCRSAQSRKCSPRCTARAYEEADLRVGAKAGAASPQTLDLQRSRRRREVRGTAAGTVSVIDAAKLREAARIKVGKAPVHVGFTPDGSRDYVSLRDENKVAGIDTSTRKVIARIKVGRAPIQVYAMRDASRRR